MRPGHHPDFQKDSGVSTLIEYVIISGVLMVLFVIVILLVNANIMQGPAETVEYHAFTDIGNGMSTRIVDVYSIAPANGNLTTAFDIPDDVAGNEYFVEIHVGETAADQYTRVYRGTVVSNISLAGISTSRNVTGNTTGQGINRIRYNSEGLE